MRSVKAALHVCAIQLRKNILSQRTGMVALLMGIYVFALLQPVRDMAVATGYGATPMALVFLSCDAVVQMLLMAGAVALFSNAPFEDETHPYLLVRAGKGAWVAGNSLYLIVTSLIYVLFLWVMSVVSLIPQVDFRLEWGKIWGTLAATDARSQYQVLFEVSIGVKRFYQPGVALLYTLLLEWGCAAFLGACVHLGNKLSSKPIGVWIGACFVFLDITIYNILNPAWLPYSPLSIAMLSNQINSRWGITLTYSAMVFIMGFILLSAASFAREKFAWRK